MRAGPWFIAFLWVALPNLALAQKVVDFSKSAVVKVAPKPSPQVSGAPSEAIVKWLNQASLLFEAVCTLIAPRSSTQIPQTEFEEMSIDECPHYDGKMWFRYLLYKRMIDLSPEFGDDCDLDGRVRMTMDTQFKGLFHVRKMANFQKIELKFDLHLEKIYDKDQFDARFEVTDGLITSKKENPISFTGECRIVTPALNGEHLPESEGRFKVEKIGDKAVPFESRFHI